MDEEQYAEPDIREYANIWAQTILGEAIAVIESAAEENGKLELPQISAAITKLRSLVGAQNREEFNELAELTWSQVGAGTLSSAYKRARFKSVMKDLKKGLGKDEFLDRYAESLMLGVEEDDWISERDVALWKIQLKEQEDFSLMLKRLIMARGLEETAKDLMIESTKLVKRVDRMNMTMSELRLLCLVLEITVDYKLTPHEEIETPGVPNPTKPSASDFPIGA